MNLTEFEKAIEKMFGSGTMYIEKLITRRLYERLGLNLEDSETNGLLVCVEDAKRQLSPKEVKKDE